MELENSCSSEEEEDYYLKTWNDWDPTSSHSTLNANCRNNICIKSPFFIHCQESISLIKRPSKFSNWIPPVAFLNVNRCCDSNILSLQKSEMYKNTFGLIHNPENDVINERSSMSCEIKVKFDVTLNSNWGKRIQLHDVTNYNDGDLTWGIVNPGIFAVIKLWVNEYNNLCGIAEGTVSKIGSPEVTVIKITNTELLRKMLNVSNAQWKSLCETVQQTKGTLIFEALKDCQLKTSLEKLWFFICKRRQFLCGQSMLVQLSGAFKCIKELKIVQKLIVLDIRDIRGQIIL